VETLLRLETDGRFSSNGKLGDGLDLRTLFSGDGPIEIEVGFGRGAFLFERAAAAPGVCLFGIEVRRKWVERVAARAKRLELPICVTHGDARLLLPQLGPDACVDRVFVHFPDPWWKKRHAKRRVLGTGMLGEVARLLKRGGELFVQTDVEERAIDYAALVDAVPELERQSIDRNPYEARSNREKRVDADGVPVYRVLAIRK
jgi:tRNA (guanine-N7-)-methyltransferase